MASRMIAVGKLSESELRREYDRTKGSTTPGDIRRYGAVKNELRRRARHHEAERTKAIRKRERSTLEVEAFRASKSLARGRFITTKTDEHGNTIEIETRNDTPTARARRYPGVVGAFSRVLANETEATRLKNKAAHAQGTYKKGKYVPSPNALTDAEKKRLTELRTEHSRLYRDYKVRFDRAVATEKKRDAAIKRAAPKPPKKVTKVSRRRDYRPSAAAAQHHEALESLLAAQRAYRTDRTDSNAQRVRRAQAKLKEAQVAIDAARAANR